VTLGSVRTSLLVASKLLVLSTFYRLAQGAPYSHFIQIIFKLKRLKRKTKNYVKLASLNTFIVLAVSDSHTREFGRFKIRGGHKYLSILYIFFYIKTTMPKSMGSHSYYTKKVINVSNYGIRIRNRI
jgi:ABC-type maltose transport system permease subunit